MDNAIIRYIFDKKKVANNSTRKGLLQIEVRETGTSKCAYVSTGIRLFANQFSSKNGFTCKESVNHAAITAQARRIYNNVEAFVLSAKCTSVTEARYYDQKEPGSLKDSFIVFIRKELSTRNPSWATLAHHNVFIRKLERFGKIQAFKDLTYENIVLFDAFIKTTIKASASLQKQHSYLHHYIREAINRGLITRDPYAGFKMPSKKSKDPTFLTEAEINRIRSYNPPIERLQKVKDMFVFQCFTGMAYTDMMHFAKDGITEMDGYKVIRSARQKTDESFISLLLPEAAAILEKYSYELPRLSNQKYNDYLKILGDGAGLNKKLTTHVARHTYATYLLNKGIPIETVSRAMGHANIKITQHYARMLGKKVIEDMKKLL